jgi:prophage antirepressor-like protein
MEKDKELMPFKFESHEVRIITDHQANRGGW